MRRPQDTPSVDGRCPAGPGCEATPSAASASSRSRIPNAVVDGKRYCKRGHPRTEETTFQRKVLVGGKEYFVRECRLCHSERNTRPSLTGRSRRDKWHSFMKAERHRRILEMYAEGVEINDIARSYGITRQGVFWIMKKHGVAPERRRAPAKAAPARPNPGAMQKGDGK